MTLRDRAINVYREEGLASLVGKTLMFVGRQFVDSTDTRREQKERIISEYSEQNRYLNVGGGDFLKENWRVLDYYTDWYDYDPIFIDYDEDLEDRNRWPIDSESYDLVYSSHTLEHLTDETVEHTLSEAFRILRPGGTIRINVPDLAVAIRAYDEGDREWFEEVWLENYTDSVYFPQEKCPGYELEFYFLSFFATYLARVRYEETDFQQVRKDWDELSAETFLDEYAGRIRDEWHAEYPGWHRNWFTAERLESELADAGFVNVRETDCRQSHVSEMCTSEFDKRPHMSVFVEAEKPG